ncbi:FERM domain-containing protein 4B [Poecilia reticulata]|uniref:FERM domain-containing protein 4B n=1 Tax=Poecilia reticulata TaxID=8081 RepID=UPI0007EBE88C|nr:PREDICTED: FERM domain-containing protein 4B-like [Poecilia reticulata]
MEVKGQLILAPEPLTCPSRKQKERMAELQERRRSLQVLLSARLAELRRICLQEAELTGAVPGDFPLEAGEKPPCVRRRAAPTRQGNRRCRAEEEDGQRPKPRKTLFSAALRKHSDSENGTHTHTHTHHGKRTVHRGCHTEDTVRSESSSTSDSAGNDNDNGGSQCRPLLVSAGSPVEVFNQNKTKKSSVLSRTEHRESTKPPPLPPSQPPPPPPRSQDSSSSSDAGREAGCRASRQSNGSDSLLTHSTPPEDEGGAQQGALRPNGATVSRGTNAAGSFWSSESLTERRGRNHLAAPEGGLRVRGGGYSEVLLDYVWEKQRQLQRQQSQPSRPLHSAGSAQQPAGAPPTYRGHHGDQRRVTVTRTKSCGPFLPVQQNHGDITQQAPPTIHCPPSRTPSWRRPPEASTRPWPWRVRVPPGLRDWYLRNTLGSTHQNQASGKVSSGANTKPSGGVKGQTGGVDALQRRRTAHGVLQQSTYQSHHYAAPHHKQTLPHSATFHGHPLHGRSVDGSLYQDSCLSQKQEVPLRDLAVDQPSPGTLV